MNAASEKEQLEALGNWWKENGSSIVIGLLLGVSALLGGKAWLSYKETQALHASHIYTQMMSELNRNEAQKVRTSANELISNYTGSAYAPLAAMVLAKVAVDEGELDAAQAQLQWALDHAGLPEVQHTARLRLIRVLIGRQQYDEATGLLAATGERGVYAYLYTELEGDLAMAQGNQAMAAQAYKQALEAMPPESPAAGLLTTKYENVAAAGLASE
ncbi:MAG: tetratricopeptide repeat protein [Thiogranum sp.]|nr:tetratricopeptide repeat protein [Thiogranum sp.]